jgi:hypothetical protein
VGAYPLHGAFAQTYLNGQSYMLILFFCTAFILIDTGVASTSSEIRYYMLMHNALKRNIKKVKQKRDRTQVTKQVAKYTNRGYAFAGEKGNDKLLIESLQNKMAMAMLKRLNSVKLQMDEEKAAADKEAALQ